jgi:hypothetical protein
MNYFQLQRYVFLKLPRKRSFSLRLSQSENRRLDNGRMREDEIKTLLDKKISKSAIARMLGVCRLMVAEFVKEFNQNKMIPLKLKTGA